MKLSEFEDRLTTVSEKKLRLMLAEGRRKGPEVAVNLILAEAARRGVDLEGGPAAPERADVPLEGFDPPPSHEDGSHGFEDAPSEAEERIAMAGGAAAGGDALSAAGSGSEGESEAESEAVDVGGTANRGAWLAEETSGGMSGMAKALIALALLAGAAGAAYWFLLKG